MSQHHDDLDERDQEYERMRRLHNLRDRDRRTHQGNKGCMIQALIGLCALAALFIIVL